MAIIPCVLTTSEHEQSANMDATADVTITIADADMVTMAESTDDGMQGFMGGKLKIKETMGDAQLRTLVAELSSITGRIGRTPRPTRTPGTT